MTLRKWADIIISICLVLVIFAGIFSEKTYAGYKDCTEEVEATIVSCEYANTTKNRIKLTIKYTYTYDGKEYDATYVTKKSYTFVSGNKITPPSQDQVNEYVNKYLAKKTVKVNPNKPSEYTFDNDTTRNWKIIIAIVPVVIIGFTLVIIIKNKDQFARMAEQRR